MAPLVLAFDIGNTSMKIGMARSNRLLATYSLPASPELCTADSLGLRLLDILRHSGMETEKRACVCVSVNPRMSMLAAGACEKYLDCEITSVPSDIPVPLNNRYTRPEETGADRLVAAWGARRSNPDATALIVVDYGTAITFDCVAGMDFLGGLIFPGPRSAIEGLAARTAKLPLISLEMAGVPEIPAKDTEGCIRSGLLLGYQALAEGICARLRDRLGGEAKIVATGGFAPVLAAGVRIFDRVEPDLVLRGLLDLYEANARNA